ncbi:MAG TPA: alkaline phosphatase family protein [Actinomycetota bacterium]|jgi:2,3-bisphosphoglycerate-independent phosphoglycerate mutase|nr:alkaline phosphatase family protein [Actinomycetota bacterium]
MGLKKILYVILDGLGDDPNPTLDGRTPLEAARTPHLDRLAERGRNGYVTTVGEGIAPESDIAVFSILGYDPREHHSGRGPLESVGVGLAVEDGDLAYRVNFATVEREGDRWRIVDRRVGRNLTSDEAHALADEVNEKVTLSRASAELRATIGHRGVLVLRSSEGPLSAEVENSDPAYGRRGSLGVALEDFEPYVVHVGPVAGAPDERARRAAALTNEWLSAAYEVLDRSEVNERRRREGKLPGNFILTRDGGDHVPKLESFKDRFGPAMGCFVEMPVELGIARLMGMGIVEAPTGIPEPEQYEAWARLTVEQLPDHDGLYVHIKGPDVPAHDGDHDAKIASIEAIDRIYFGGVLPEIDLDGVVVAVTADHSTSCIRKAHTDGPVPLLVSGGNVTADRVDVYGETAARHGSLGHLLGPQIMPNLVDAARL